MFDVRELIVTDEDLTKLSDCQHEALDYETWSKMFAEIAKSCRAEIPADAPPIDRIMWIARKTYIAGFLEAFHTVSETVRSCLAEEEGGGQNVNHETGIEGRNPVL